jgi:hypothetical protein
MEIRIEQLEAPKYVVGGGQLANSALQGLKASGPYSMGSCPTDPRVLFVFAEEFKDYANQLFLALKNGVGPFPGVERLFRFRLSTSSVVRLNAFSVPPRTSDGDRARAYVQAIDAGVAKLAPRPDIAVVIHPRTDQRNEDNPYLAAKYRLLRANIATQTVTVDLLSNPQTLQWSVANIALAMFAKMGGQPWAISTGLSPDSLIVGINRTFVSRGASAARNRVFGFATTFSHNGVYLQTRLFPVAESWEEYLRTLESSLRQLTHEWQQNSRAPVPLVFHVQRELRKSEMDVIESCLASETNKSVKEYSVLRLSDDAGMLIVDDARSDSMVPSTGTLVYLSGHRALLQVTGQTSGGPVGKIVTAGPLQITKTVSSPAAPPLSLLAQHTMALAHVNWRGLNSEAWPVSLAYPHRLAELLGRFAAAGLDISELLDRSVMGRPWFL